MSNTSRNRAEIQLAIELGLPVVPVALAGTAQGMPKGGGIWVRPARPAVRVLEPLSVQGLCTKDAPALAARARDLIDAERAKLRA